MLRLSPILIFIVILFSSLKEKPAGLIDVPGIIPAPVQMKSTKGYLQWNKTVTLVANTESEKSSASFLQAFFSAKNIQVNIKSSSNDKTKITFSTISDSQLGDEGYKLNSSKNGVSIEANSGTGLFYGLQSFLQLVSLDGKQFPFVEVTDYPRFAYRGMHLDVGRHMFPPEFIKKYIDLMAHHKFNRFHWHLTEDQGWRIEIKKYPKLQEVGAFRNETLVGHSGPADKAVYDGKRYGGFYTQAEVKEIVKYAADRHITVIPEIEMPGHALAALASYPTLGCTGGPYEVGKKWG
ncbi:MAG TPA: family 20 glycosylhydrolase, partial [Cyclobacteriaceae bacterium]|nr:family 20 glycosylhydrolase [Cyclobacteriaceae bacterium]